MQACPGGFSDWSRCSETCGPDGTQTRTCPLSQCTCDTDTCPTTRSCNTEKVCDKVVGTIVLDKLANLYTPAQIMVFSDTLEDSVMDQFDGGEDVTGVQAKAMVRIEYAFEMSFNSFAGLIETIGISFCLATDIIEEQGDRSTNFVTLTCGPTTITIDATSRRLRRMLSTGSNADGNMVADGEADEVTQNENPFDLNTTFAAMPRSRAHMNGLLRGVTERGLARSISS